jgi:choline dehydrogenase-like flavoprotein
MKIVVVGCGASAVHFAQSVLEKGHTVVMVDVGRMRPDPVRPADSFEKLKHSLEDPALYFLGTRFQAVTYPGAPGEYYGFPPHKDYVFEGIDSLPTSATGFAPLGSYAQGGLAETWTGGVYPFNEAELRDFPFSFADLLPYYGLVAERIGIAGEIDDLARHYPLHENLRSPLELDEHSRLLLDTYGRKREELASLGVTLGRSRIAVLTEDHFPRKACARLGRCLFGCPVDALYTPLATLRRCFELPGFAYRGGRFVSCLRLDSSRRIGAVVTKRLADSVEEEFAGDAFVLAAGTLSSARIFLETWKQEKGEAPRLTGLMDNRQVLVPFLNLAMLGRAHDPDTYQYHQLTARFETEDARDAVHALVTTLKTALIHPIVQRIPFDLKTALSVFRNVHAALGLVNVNFPDDRRATNWVELERQGQRSVLRVHYEPPPKEAARIQATTKRLSRFLRKLGCVVPVGLSHVRPMGASVHYAGTFPMTREEARFTTDANGKARDFDNLWFADGSTFPFLPAKNLTFTLMANAARIAARQF